MQLETREITKRVKDILVSVYGYHNVTVRSEQGSRYGWINATVSFGGLPPKSKAPKTVEGIKTLFEGIEFFKYTNEKGIEDDQIVINIID